MERRELFKSVSGWLCAIVARPFITAGAEERLRFIEPEDVDRFGDDNKVIFTDDGFIIPSELGEIVRPTTRLQFTKE